MPPAKSLGALFARTLVLVIVLTGLWSQVAGWTSRPVAVISHMALEFGAPLWVESVKKTPQLMEVQTRLVVPVQGGVGEVVVEADPSHYAYGLPILWALLLATGGPLLLPKLAVGYVLLLPAQAFSLTLDLLRQMAFAVPGGARALGVSQWQLETIGLGYQLGTLIVPTLVPILIWLMLDRAFAEQLLQPRNKPPSP